MLGVGGRALAGAAGHYEGWLALAAGADSRTLGAVLESTGHALAAIEDEAVRADAGVAALDEGGGANTLAAIGTRNEGSGAVGALTLLLAEQAVGDVAGEAVGVVERGEGGAHAGAGVDDEAGVGTLAAAVHVHEGVQAVEAVVVGVAGRAVRDRAVVAHVAELEEVGRADAS